ncbi:hypothetical protein [Chroococcidiopsis sp. CCNUC1]|uniref:hypothetical protein n=1 Tax=Chroococcidiopsis sp. CCNUC1 TaxID=2653189 RepID=UPI0020222D63|nr:hypothetical protein [Chroococcidiopsis sp. CCNUC1]URD49554.1 hypothetical protein M5J74_24935 [Chroococcidiopsis sp. CCNUC1]
MGDWSIYGGNLYEGVRSEERGARGQGRGQGDKGEKRAEGATTNSKFTHSKFTHSKFKISPHPTPFHRAPLTTLFPSLLAPHSSLLIQATIARSRPSCLAR